VEPVTNADLEVGAEARVGGWVVLATGSGVSVAGAGELFFIDPATASGRRVATGAWDYDDVRLADGAEGAILLVSGRTLWTVEPRSGAMIASVRPRSLDRLGSAVQVGSQTWIRGSSRRGADVVARIELDTGAVLDRFEVGRGGHLVGTAGFLFTGSLGSDGASILRIDPRSGEMTAVPIPTLGSIAASSGQVWFTTSASVECLDAVRLVPCGHVSIERPGSLAVDGDRLWVLSFTGSRSSRLYVPDPEQPATVTLVDVTTARPIGRPLTLPDTTPASIAAFGGSAWVGFHDTGRILRIDA
jgi:hypothetical protein